MKLTHSAAKGGKYGEKLKKGLGLRFQNNKVGAAGSSSGRASGSSNSPGRGNSVSAAGVSD